MTCCLRSQLGEESDNAKPFRGHRWRRIWNCASASWGSLSRYLCRQNWYWYLGNSCLSIEIEDRDQDTTNGYWSHAQALKPVEEGSEMSEKIALICGSGNVFSDFDRQNACLAQARATLVAGIICTLYARGLSRREAKGSQGLGIRNSHASATRKYPVSA